MIPLSSICRLQNFCQLRSIISRGIHLQRKLGLHKTCAAQCTPQWTRCVSVVCFNSQQKVCCLNLRPVRSFSTDPDSKMVHILDSNNELVQKMTLKRAHIMAQKEGMKLFHVRKERLQEAHVDEYKLLSEVDIKKAILKDKDQHREKFKEYNISVNIHDRDLTLKLKLMKRNLLKGSRVKLVLSSQGYSKKPVRQHSMEGKVKADAEQVIATCLEELKDTARVTSVTKGNKVYVYEFKAFDSINNPQK
ncbi:uncharacterized protein LOC110456546 [Mizuhopecten yessoensis]|uniref:Uncharacterized protein n=1 Tax=Mizuhopecten yessoensis TaxID=6573 RepID=A0A210QAM2_MIZYE|nr:uncharacterized protein LOC110456546 [Mizuhopecten yessoensis]XP_021363022.1 uncharacterized protein LOC110456546 [Mizuhopecten yessoensis]OWF45784.1 hypothetical protein KP79_PYT13049 [Mizuhopecten yessoensis]